jgi:hypothetical protein
MTVLLKKQQIFSLNIAKLITYIYEQGYTCTLGECFRTPEQALIYAKSGKGIKDSLHCKRLALDINLFSPEGVYLPNTSDYEPLGVYWESLNPANRWGGLFKPRSDGNHIEMQDI